MPTANRRQSKCHAKGVSSRYGTWTSDLISRHLCSLIDYVGLLKKSELRKRFGTVKMLGVFPSRLLLLTTRQIKYQSLTASFQPRDFCKVLYQQASFLDVIGSKSPRKTFPKSL